MEVQQKREPASISSHPDLAYFMFHDTTLGAPVRRIFVGETHNKSVVIQDRPMKAENGTMQAVAINEAGELEIYQLKTNEENFAYWVLVNAITQE